MADIVNPELERYAQQHTSAPTELLEAVAAETHAELVGRSGMMVGPLEGRFLEMMVFGTRAKRILEIGTFTGYSALSMAAALPAGGRIITCDIDPVHISHARRHFAASPFADVIELREGPAIETIATLEGPFDLIFIDADKTSYRAYYEATLPLLAPNGLLLVDNTLWSGRVLDEGDTDPDTAAIRAFNDFVVADARVTCVQLTIRDGVTVIRRNAAGGTAAEPS